MEQIMVISLATAPVKSQKMLLQMGVDSASARNTDAALLVS